MDAKEYCIHCEKVVTLTELNLMDVVQWVCPCCGIVIDQFFKDFD
jgi:predicted RNA-binding Zn-ribbon protein involved in translation (DUF1610 family)